VKVGVEETENLTVTWNALITKSSFYLTLLAAILALVFVVTLAGDADARHKKPTAYFSKAEITDNFEGTGQPFEPPDHFDCVYNDSPDVHDYECTGSATFRLSNALKRSGNPPPGEGFDSVAAPDSLECSRDSNLEGNRSAEQFICEYSDGQHTHIFRLNEMVCLTYDADIAEAVDHPKRDRYLPPRDGTVPTVVPSGADDVGGGSTAGLIGLLLAASGVVAGTVVVARRRLLHDS
jgi:hypothetical protein